jgi:hypothetical protein
MAWSKNMLTAVYVRSFEAYVFEWMRLRFNLSDVVKTFDAFNHHNGVSLVWYFRTGMKRVATPCFMSSPILRTTGES